MEGTAKSRRTSAHEPLLTRLMKLGAQESLEAPQELAPARQEACKVSSPELRRRASSFEQVFGTDLKNKLPRCGGGRTCLRRSRSYPSHPLQAITIIVFVTGNPAVDRTRAGSAQ